MSSSPFLTDTSPWQAVRGWWRGAVESVTRLWWRWRRPANTATVPLPEPVDEIPPLFLPPPHEEPAAARPTEFYAEEETITLSRRHDLKALLDDLPLYFSAMRHLAKIPEYYGLFARIGMPLWAASSRAGMLGESGAITEPPPSFMAMFHPGRLWRWEEDNKYETPERVAKMNKDLGNKKDWVSIWMMTKLQPHRASPLGWYSFIPWGDEYYECVEVATNTTGLCHIPPRIAYMGVEFSTGRCKFLAQPTVIEQSLPTPRRVNERRAGGHNRAVHLRVGLPLWIKEIMADNVDWNRRDKGHRITDADEYATFMFNISRSITQSAERGWQINVDRGGDETARFVIVEGDAKRFFADREMYTTESGARRRIFHHVVEHDRTLATGKVVSVRDHYRGQRQFAWKEHNIMITVPGHHHAKISEFTASAEDESTIGKRAGVTMPKFGAIMRRHIRGAPLLAEEPRR